MEYEGRICRAGSERGSFMLPTAVGCSYNGCLFCGLFKDLKYRELELSDVRAELERVKSLGADPSVVYLGDGNAFHQSFERLVGIAEMLHEYFPSLKEIRMDSTVPDIARKSADELKVLAQLGVGRLYIGIETALPDVLLRMKKCHTSDMALRETDRLHEAGIRYAAHVMFGIAGKGRGEENAKALAAFINRTEPALTVNFSFFPGRLEEELGAGRFTRAGEAETLLEDKVFSGLVSVPMDYESYHDNYSEATKFHLKGSFPKDRERFLKRLDSVLEKLEHTKQFPTVL